MTIPLGPLRLDISLSLVDGASPGWEELAAVEMPDQEMALLNQRNTHQLEDTRWSHLLHFIVESWWR